MQKLLGLLQGPTRATCLLTFNYGWLSTEGSAVWSQSLHLSAASYTAMSSVKDVTPCVLLFSSVSLPFPLLEYTYISSILKNSPSTLPWSTSFFGYCLISLPFLTAKLRISSWVCLRFSISYSLAHTSCHFSTWIIFSHSLVVLCPWAQYLSLFSHW